MNEPSPCRTPEEYIERYFRRASDRALARNLGWSRERVAHYVRKRGLRRTATEEAALGEVAGEAIPPPTFTAEGEEPFAIHRLRAGDHALAAGLGLLVLALWLPLAPGRVTGVHDAHWAVVAATRAGPGLLQGFWPALGRLGWRLSGRLEPAMVLEILSATGVALSVFLAALALRALRFSRPATSGAALLLGLGGASRAAALGCGPTSLDAAMALLVIVAFHSLRRRASWPPFLLTGACLVLAVLHGTIPSSPAPPGRTDSLLDLVRPDTLPLTLLGLVGIGSLARLSSGWCWAWSLVALPTLLVARPLFGLALLVLPAAAALDSIGRSSSRPAPWRPATAAALAVLSATLSIAGAPAAAPTARELGRAAIAAAPDGSRIWCESPSVHDLLGYEIRASGRADRVTLGTELPPIGDLPPNEVLFLAGARTVRKYRRYRPAPRGFLWRLRVGGSQRRLPPASYGEGTLAKALAGSPDAFATDASEGELPYLREAAISRAAAAEAAERAGWLRAAARLSEETETLLWLASLAGPDDAGRALAVELWELAARRDPRAAAPRRALARRALRSGKREEARRLALEAQALEPGEAEDELLLGEIAEAEKGPRKAIEHYETAKGLAPTNYRVWRLLALAHRRLGEEEKALECAEKSLRLLPHQFDLRQMFEAAGRHAPSLDPGQSRIPQPPGLPGRPGLPGLPGLPGQPDLPGRPSVPGRPSPTGPGRPTTGLPSSDGPGPRARPGLPGPSPVGPRRPPRPTPGGLPR